MTRGEPVVSVVMPVRDGELYLAEAIESILRQTLADLELIIVDDGSSDSTPDLLARYANDDMHVQVIRTPPRGYVEALNLGCGVSRAPIVARMDADDVAAPTRLEAQVAYLREHPDVALLGTGHTEIDHRGVVVGTTAYPTAPDEVAKRLPVKNCLAHPTVVFRRAVFEQLGGYRTALEPAEDYDLWLRIAERHPVANLPQPLLAYRIHPGSVSLRNLRRRVLSQLAAQAAARVRRSGGDDGLSRVGRLTPELLEELGVDRTTLEHAVFVTCLAHAERAVAERHDDLALELGREALASAEHFHLRSAEVAAVHRVLAIASFRQRRLGRAVGATLVAVSRRPALLAAPFRRASSGRRSAGEGPAPTARLESSQRLEE